MTVIGMLCFDKDDFANIGNYDISDHSDNSDNSDSQRYAVF